MQILPLVKITDCFEVHRYCQSCQEFDKWRISGQ